jgi:hypothetical protein
MTTIRARIPDSLYLSACQLTEKEGMPLERLVGLALAQAIGAWMSQRNLIQERAKRGNREKFLAALNKVPDVPPVAGDELLPE